MTELTGTLEGVGLPSIVRFIAGLNKTGCLRVSQGDWRGDVFFEDGRVIGASFGSRTGLAALDALVQALPAASFVFESSACAEGEPTIQMSQEMFEAHLDELGSATRTAATPKLPAVDAVPELVAEHDPRQGDESVSLDRGSLQTLLAVDGRRTVREIVAQRGSVDVLWQLGNLVEVGLVRLAEREASVVAAEPPVERPAELPVEKPAEPPVETPTIVRPFAAELEPHKQLSRCPKLGFEDDPSNSFGRPTRLHRCFAAGTPQPLSLDQQRELCLTEQFGVCPRLAPTRAQPGTEDVAAEPASDDSRIVRLPHVARANAADRARATEANADADRQLTARRQAFGDRRAATHAAADAAGGAAVEPPSVGPGSPDRSRFRPGHQPVRDDAAPRPMPLRARFERPSETAAATALADSPVPAPPLPSREPRQVEPRSIRQPAVDEPGERRFRGIPLTLIALGAVGVVVLAVFGYLLVPRLGTLNVDDTIDTSRLPNTSAVAAGTPVGQLASPRLTPVARATAESVTATPPAPAPTQPAAEPTVLPQVPDTLLDESLWTSASNWPNNPQGTAWLANGSYQLATRQTGQFVAISAPIAEVPPNVTVSARFHKVGGPAGGGFGLIVRDQGPGALDGTKQDGSYYVLEVGDKGEIGIWRRDGDHWVDLLPWQRSEAVKPGTATNDLTVRAFGSSLSMFVNGTQVAVWPEATLTNGNVGLFVGGDGNQVAVEHFVVQAP